MKKIHKHMVGIDDGSVTIFSDYGNDGEMWTGQGNRKRSHQVKFSEPFASKPTVMASMSMWDTDKTTNQRMDLAVEDITLDGFYMVFSTWADTRIARIRASWIAVGEVKPDEEEPNTTEGNLA